MQIKCILHCDYGGFHLDTEMAYWLLENKSWDIVKHDNLEAGKKYPIYTLVDMGGDCFYPVKDSIKFRSDSDLIECIETLKLKHKNDPYPESLYGLIHKLKVSSFNIVLEIEEYNDGHERLTAQMYEEDYE